jgi:hypothetical protein
VFNDTREGARYMDYEIDIARRMADTPGATPDVSIVLDLDDEKVAERSLQNSGVPVVRMLVKHGGKQQWVWLHVQAHGFELRTDRGLIVELEVSDIAGFNKRTASVQKRIYPSKQGVSCG